MRRIILLFLSLLIIINANAGIESFLNNAVVEVENSTSAKTDNYNVYFGGGIHLRTPRMTFQPFQVTAPSIKVGCGGIDIVFGSFSYFRKEYLVSFVKKTVSQAPALAFWTAVQTLCPQCQQLQSKLSDLANAINSINFDSCATAQMIGGAVGNWTGKTLNKALNVGAEGPDWLKGFNNAIENTTNFINDKFNQAMNSKGCNPQNDSCYLHFFVSSYQSLLNFALRNNSHFSSSTGFKNILRAMTGDIKKLGNSGEKKLKYLYIAPTIKGAELEKVLYGIMGFESNCGNWTYDRALGEGANTTSATTETICSYVKRQIDSIIDKIQTRKSLTQKDIQFLSMFRIPVYKLFNTLSMQPGTLSAVKDELTRILTAELTYEILSSIFSDFNRVSGELLNASKDGNIPIDAENIRYIQKNQAEILHKAHELVAVYTEEFRKQLQDNFYIEKLRAMLMSSLARNPVMGSRLYTQSLLGFGF